MIPDCRCCGRNCGNQRSLLEDDRQRIKLEVKDTYEHALSASLPYLDLLRSIPTRDFMGSTNLDEQIALVRRVLRKGLEVFE
jgi:hypothetical protein